jgi:hypothetical protein
VRLLGLLVIFNLIPFFYDAVVDRLTHQHINVKSLDNGWDDHCAASILHRLVISITSLGKRLAGHDDRTQWF